MIDDKTHINSHAGAALGSHKSYIVGFILSLVLTLEVYLIVSRHAHTHHIVFSHRFLVPAILILAITQLFVQLIFFLHLGRESKPRWNLVVLLFSASVVIILVLGSLWIMYNLNYHAARPAGDQSIIHDEGIHGYGH